MIQPHSLIKLPDSPLEEFKADEIKAYYIAGKASSILLGNKQRNLPAVYFEITAARQRDFHPSEIRPLSIGLLPVHLEGGRLIQNLTVPFAELTRGFNEEQTHQFRSAVEADIVNLMAGAAAEARYRIQHFGETMSGKSLPLTTLHVYADNVDLDQIGDYMDCLSLSKTEHERILTELFAIACEFVESESNWMAITALARFIHNEADEEITCEQLIALLEDIG